MRLPRFTTRRLMVLVAIAGVVLGAGQELRRRSSRYRAIAIAHLPNSRHIFGNRWETSPQLDYHDAMFEKYDRLARYPWLPVPPDPPMPE